LQGDSKMCGGGGAPQDNSDKVAAIEAETARAAREQQALDDAQARTDFESRLGAAYSGSVDSARNFFVNQGLDPETYMSSISDAANAKKMQVPILDGSPGTYFDNLGQSVFDQLQSGERNQAMRGIDTFARDGFARSRIDDTADDNAINSILGEQRATADEYIERLLSRGIITNSGRAAASSDLDNQSFRVKNQIGEVGGAQIEKGRGDLRNIASDGRSAASQLRLGDAFDPFGYDTQINDSATAFFASLGDNLRGSTPQNLFNTGNLANVAGRAQGAQNTPFSAAALAGLDEEEEDPEDVDEVFAAF
jgi:hypothetical protein